jgi:hypothetical protein
MGAFLRDINYSIRRQKESGVHDAPVSARGFRDYRDKTTSFETVAVETNFGANLTGTGDPERMPGTRVSGDWTLGRHAAADTRDRDTNHLAAIPGIGRGAAHRRAPRRPFLVQITEHAGALEILRHRAGEQPRRECGRCFARAFHVAPPNNRTAAPQGVTSAARVLRSAWIPASVTS